MLRVVGTAAPTTDADGGRRSFANLLAAATSSSSTRATTQARRQGQNSGVRPAEGEVMCSFAQNGEEFLEQHWYYCYTCGKSNISIPA